MDLPPSTGMRAFLSELQHFLADNSHEQQVLSSSTTARQDAVESLLQTLENSPEEDFLQQYNLLKTDICNGYQKRLLIAATAHMHTKSQAFEAILSNVKPTTAHDDQVEYLLFLLHTFSEEEFVEKYNIKGRKLYFEYQIRLLKATHSNGKRKALDAILSNEIFSKYRNPIECEVQNLLDFLKNGSEENFLTRYNLCAENLSIENQIRLFAAVTTLITDKIRAFDAISSNVTNTLSISKTACYNVELLLRTLRKRSEKDFLQQYNSLGKELSFEYKIRLLQAAQRQDKGEALNAILSNEIFSQSVTPIEDEIQGLLHTLLNGSKEDFLAQYNLCAGNLSNENQKNLLIAATAHRQNKSEAFGVILSNIKTTTARDVLVEFLLGTLMIGSEEDFRTQYNICADKLSNGNNIILLLAVTAHNQDKRKAFDDIFSNVSDINYTIEDVDLYNLMDISGNSNVFEVAYTNHNLEALEKILNRADFNYLPATVDFVGRKFLNMDMFLSFRECFDKLLYSKKIDINKVGDVGFSLLDYALHHKNVKAMETLLSAGAYLGSKNKHLNRLTIDDFDPLLLKKWFDLCISSNDYLNDPYSKTYHISFDYKNLKPPTNLKDSENNFMENNFEDLENHSTEMTKIMANVEDSKNNFNEMTPIMQIACSKEKQHLLEHPFITTFMAIKWNRISVFFYANVILYCMYGISMIAYIILKCEGFASDHPMVKLAFWFSIFGIIFLTIREITQVWPLKKYFSKPINYLEIPLIVLSIITITIDFQTSGEKAFVVATIILMFVTLFFLVRPLPFFGISTHMLMLEEVLKTFIKSFSLYFVFLLAFSLCFYILIGEENVIDGKIIRNGTDEMNINIVNGTHFRNDTDGKDERSVNCKEDEPNMFKNVFKSFVKVMAMFVGELDLANLSSNNAYCDFLFLLFVVSMTVVLMNLLNGLAVYDTQIIRNRADINALICRAKVLYTFEDYYFPFNKKLRKDYEIFIRCIHCICSTEMIYKCSTLTNCSSVMPPVYCEACIESINRMNIVFSKILNRSFDGHRSVPNVLKKKTEKYELQILEEIIKNQLRNIEEQNKIIIQKLQAIVGEPIAAPDQNLFRRLNPVE